MSEEWVEQIKNQMNILENLEKFVWKRSNLT